MLIKFESKRAASFHMQSEVAQQLLSMMGQGGKLEGSISGAAIAAAQGSLEKAIADQAASEVELDDEEDEREHVSLSARAAPLKEMLQHAKNTDSYVMWRPE